MNLAFFIIFGLENLIRILGLGLKHFFNDSYNLFDSAIEIIGLIDVVINFSFMEANYDSKAVVFFRASRVLRIFKVARYWKSF